MKILEAFGEPISYGGQEAFVMNALSYIDSSDMEIDLLSPYYCDNNSIIRRIEARGGHVYVLNSRFAPGNVRASEAGPIRKFLEEHDYDVIHIHSSSNSMLGMYVRLAHKARIPKIIVHSHCTGRSGWKHFTSKVLTSFSLTRYPDEYCACSREAGEWRFPAKICRKQLIVINNGIDVSRFRFDENVRMKMRAELGANDDTTLIGCVGRLTYQKNQSFLLDVMKRLFSEQSREADYRLLLIGDGEDRSMLEEYADRLGIRSRVVFTGSVEDTSPYLQAMDIACMPSKYEGLAIAAIEAQAAGLEMILSDAVTREIDLTGNVTFLPIEDAKVWTEALRRVRTRHPEQANMIEARGYGSVGSAKILERLYRDNR